MDKKLIVITIAMAFNMMVGCSNQSNDKISKDEKGVTATDTVKNNSKEQEDEKESEDKTNIVSEEELKTKKEQYLERIQVISQKYEDTYAEYENGNLCDADLGNGAIEAYEEYDKVLNEIYQDLKKYLPENKMQDIKEEQLKWVDNKEEKEEYIKKYTTSLQAELAMVDIIKDRCIELLDYLVSGDKKIEETQGSNISTNDIISELYTILGESKNDIEYVYSPNDNYVSDNNIKNDYYIFQVNTYIDGGDIITSDYNVLVNKENYEIYNYYPDGKMDQIGKIEKKE